MTKSKRLAVLLAALVAISMVAMAVAPGAALADEHTTEIGGETDTVEYFNASEDEYILVTLEADGADFGEDETDTVYANITYDDVELFDYSADVDADETEYEFNVSHDELELLPGDAEETTEIELNAWGEDADADDDDDVESTEMVTLEVDIEFDETHAVVTAFEDDDDVAEFEAAEDGMFGLSFGPLGSDATADVGDDVGIAGYNTTIHTYADDGDMIDVFDDSVEDMESGDRVGLLMTSTLDNQIVYVFADEAGEDIFGDDVDEDEDTFAVYHGDGHMEYNLGEDRFDEDDEEVDVNSASGVDVDASDLRDDLEYSLTQSFGLSLDQITSFDWVPFIGFLTNAALAGGLVASRRMEA